MILRETPILLDANAITACHEFGCWNAVSKHFRLETAEACVIEFQTGGHAQKTDEYVDEPTLRAGFRHIHTPTRSELAEVLLVGGAGIHYGERHLWAHALSRTDTWVLCGPDRGSMRFGCDQNHGQRLIALGMLLDQIKHPAARDIPYHYTHRWLEDVRRNYILKII